MADEKYKCGVCGTPLPECLILVCGACWKKYTGSEPKKQDTWLIELMSKIGVPLKDFYTTLTTTLTPYPYKKIWAYDYKLKYDHSKYLDKMDPQGTITRAIQKSIASGQPVVILPNPYNPPREPPFKL